jgi:hypothetical protein
MPVAVPSGIRCSRIVRVGADLPDAYQLIGAVPRIADHLMLRERAGLSSMTWQQAEAGWPGSWAACHVVHQPTGDTVAMGRSSATAAVSSRSSTSQCFRNISDAGLATHPGPPARPDPVAGASGRVRQLARRRARTSVVRQARLSRDRTVVHRHGPSAWLSGARPRAPPGSRRYGAAVTGLLERERARIAALLAAAKRATGAPCISKVLAVSGGYALRSPVRDPTR